MVVPLGKNNVKFLNRRRFLSTATSASTSSLVRDTFVASKFSWILGSLTLESPQTLGGGGTRCRSIGEFLVRVAEKLQLYFLLLAVFG